MKYFYNEDRLDPKILPLYFIANELAEANRLKRIEIEWSNDQMIGEKKNHLPKVLLCPLKNLKEDQAN